MSESVSKMSDEQLIYTWKSLGEQSWDGYDMYNETVSMDEWGMIIYSEMDSRGLSKFYR